MADLQKSLLAQEVHSLRSQVSALAKRVSHLESVQEGISNHLGAISANVTVTQKEVKVVAHKMDSMEGAIMTKFHEMGQALAVAGRSMRSPLEDGSSG